MNRVRVRLRGGDYDGNLCIPINRTTGEAETKGPRIIEVGRDFGRRYARSKDSDAEGVRIYDLQP